MLLGLLKMFSCIVTYILESQRYGPLVKKYVFERITEATD